MPVVDDYLTGLSGSAKEVIAGMYDVVRQEVPDAEQGLCYAMPAYKYKGKGLAAIMANKSFLSLYPFCAVERLGIDMSAFECTSGSIHFSQAHPISDDMLRKIITARRAQIDSLTPNSSIIQGYVSPLL